VSGLDAAGRDPAARGAHVDPAVAAADTEAERRAASQSLGDLVSELTGDLSTLMRQELALAKAEAKEQATRAGKGAGMLGGAGYAAALVVLFLSLALMWALGDLLDHVGWGALIVAVLWAIVAAVLYFAGRKALAKVEPMPQTVDSVKHIPDALHTKEELR
jgi:hypothetical protein